jgi:hypothetical protein
LIGGRIKMTTKTDQETFIELLGRDDLSWCIEVSQQRHEDMLEIAFNAGVAHGESKYSKKLNERFRRNVSLVRELKSMKDDLKWALEFIDPRWPEEYELAERLKTKYGFKDE